MACSILLSMVPCPVPEALKQNNSSNFMSDVPLEK